MQLQEVSEWLQKYNSNNESVDLENEIEDIISQKDFLTREDLIKIVGMAQCIVYPKRLSA